MFSYTNEDIDFAHKQDYASSPKDEYGKHMHYFYELVYFIQGDVDYTIEDETRHLESGDIAFIKPGQFHFATVNRKKIYERYVVKFPEEALPPFLLERVKELEKFYPVCSTQEYLFKQLDYVYEHYDGEEISLLFLSKLEELLINLSKLGNQDTQEKDPRISRITTYIEEHIKEKMTLKEIAQDLGYSESYLSAIFRDKMKISLMQYIRSKKVIAARTFIINGSKPQEVSDFFGFSDYSTFYRSYIKVSGYPPNKDKK